eukprot:1021082-Rhodomonas_salina.1
MKGVEEAKLRDLIGSFDEDGDGQLSLVSHPPVLLVPASCSLFCPHPTAAMCSIRADLHV